MAKSEAAAKLDRVAVAVTSLDSFHSWKLERISAKTFPRDIVVKLNGVSEDELTAVGSMVKRGCCFRCRIAKGRYYFGETAADAALAAIKAEKGSGHGKRK